MDTTYEIRNNYLFLKVTGHFDVDPSKEILYETNEKLRIHKLGKVVLDVTEVKGLEDKQNSVGKIFDLSILISEFIPVGTKISLLETKDQIRKYSLFEDILTYKGFHVKVTANYEEGLKWLGVLSEEKT
jgi:hypothetical protein